MSSTRKIEGYLTAHDDNGPGYELGNGAGFGSFWEGDATKFLPDALPVVLIIGGKGYTEEEVKAILKDVITAQSDPSQFVTRQRSSFLGDWIKAAVSKALATHDIQLP